MHGCSPGSAVLVNAEVDSMGGLADGRVSIGNKTSPQRVSIEKAQTELRLEYDVREERRRELEFLEKGGNPLDFKLGNVASVSVQSTSLTEQHLGEAKGSFLVTASPHGDSVESSGRPQAPLVGEPNSADNLMLFDGENEPFEGQRSSLRHVSSNIATSERSSQLDCSKIAKELGDSAAFGVPRKAYRRRFRSRPSHDGVRSSSTDALRSRVGQGSSLPTCHGPRDAKGLVLDADNQKAHVISSNCKSNPASPNGSMVPKILPSDTRLDMELDGKQAVKSTTGPMKAGLADAVSEANASKNLSDFQHNEYSKVDAQGTPTVMASEGSQSVGGKAEVILGDLEGPPCVGITNSEKQATFSQVNGFSSNKVTKKCILDEVKNVTAASSIKGLESKSSRTQARLSVDRNNDSEVCTKIKNIDTNGDCKEQNLNSGDYAYMESNQLIKQENDTKDDVSCALINDDCNTLHQSHRQNGSSINVPEESNGSGRELRIEERNSINVDGMKVDGVAVSEREIKQSDFLGDNITSQNKNACNDTLQGPMDSATSGIPVTSFSATASMDASEKQMCSVEHLKLASKTDEDTILEEARIIEAKQKRIAELSFGPSPVENHKKSHWDYVLEEMAWLANDFAQERLWKITAAAQLCHRASFTLQLRLQEQHTHRKQKKLAHTLAKAVMEFWHSVEEKNKELPLECTGKDYALPLQGYAMRFLQDNNSYFPQSQAEAPITPDRIYDLGMLDMSWEDNLTEENLFYTVPPEAMEVYRKSIESHLVQYSKTSSSMQEEYETSAYDAIADFEAHENAYEEDEGETSAYCLSGAFEGSRSLKFAHKKRENSRTYGARSYEQGTDLPFAQCTENKIGTQQPFLMGKRPVSSLNVSIPRKRMRTASRQRVLTPFTAGTSGCVQAPNKTDASSGDTTSFQDDQSTSYGGPEMPNSLEVESVGHFRKQLPSDSLEEVSRKPKKKNKAKHMGSRYGQRWQLDSNFSNDQRDFSKKRLDSYQLESNGSSGLFGQHINKKPKMMQQLVANVLDNLNQMGGSIPSPAASQMSNMSNSNKFIKMIGGRDRGRKTKGQKIPLGHLGFGSPWSLFEDQALVVLVHDMGPNWELISDAINSALQFKYIFRTPMECKERHKIVMDRTTSDGADSAEDSGSSQPYPSTLPGIPKGSARQLFQRLQGPMEEDTLKSHFEKIIMLAEKHLSRKTQDPKPRQQPHSSHELAISQVYPNGLKGGPSMTPLDFCDTTPSSPDGLLLGHQGPHASAAATSNQGSMIAMLPASGASSSASGSSSNIIRGSNLASASSPLNASVRDGRYGASRTASLSVDEKQRMQQYNQMLSGRNIQQSGLSVPGGPAGTDRGVRMLPGGNSINVMGGLNRSMSMVRPGFQGIASSPIQTSGGMVSSGTVAMPSAVNMHLGTGSGQGNSTPRHRDSLNVIWPGQSPESQRQTMVPDLQNPVSQGNSNSNNTGAPSFGGLTTSSFSNQTTSPPVHSFGNSHHPHLQSPNHATNTQHQAYAARFAKERHMKQQRLQQQQKQFAASNNSMPHSQMQSQHPISSSSSPSQTTTAPVSMSPLTPSSSMAPILQQQQTQPHGIGRSPQTGGSGMVNQMGKPRQRVPQQHQQQQFLQAGRQRQGAQSQLQGKLMKGGVGRGNMMMHQNITIDPSLLNGGLSATSGTQSSDHLIHSQDMYSGSGLNHVHQSKPLSQQKLVPQSQPNVRRVVPQNRPMSSGPMTNHLDNSSMASSTNAAAAQSKVSDPLYDSRTENPSAQLGSVGVSDATTPPVGQGFGRRLSSGGLTPLGHDEWQQQSSQLQQPPTPPPLPSSQQSPRNLQPPQNHS